MKILFCYESGGKSVYFESLSFALKEKGHEIETLFFCEKGHLQAALEQDDIKCFNYISNKKGFISTTFDNTVHLIRFAKKTKPDFIFSHLSQANLYTALAAHFLPKIKVAVCRHNADESYQTNNKNGIRFDKIVNFLAPRIVVISEKAFQHLSEIEQVPLKKLTFLPLAYDFKRYKKEVYQAQKRDISTTRLRVIFISRLVPLKRIEQFLPVIQHFQKQGFFIETTIVGEGSCENALKQQAKDLGIADLVHSTGFQEDVIPHILASDLLVHLSVSESSNQVVKEAGYCGKTVIACKEVGDFDTYLNESNAYLLPKNFTKDELIYIVEQIFQNRSELKNKGEKLYETIMERFTLTDGILEQYLTFFKM